MPKLPPELRRAARETWTAADVTVNERGEHLAVYAPCGDRRLIARAEAMKLAHKLIKAAMGVKEETGDTE